MKRLITILSVFFVFVLLVSCKGPGQGIDGKSVNSTSPDRLLPLTDFTVVNAPNAPTRITRNIERDKEGNLIMVSYEGVIRYDGKSFKNLSKDLGLEQCYAFDALEDKKGNIWIASDQEGVFHLDLTTAKVTNFNTEDGLGHRRNMCIYEDQAGNIWVGGQGGLSRYDGKSFVNFSTEDGMPHNDVNTIIEDRVGKIWFGTRGHAGMYDGEIFTEITNNEGVPFFNVWSIMEDKAGDIWLADSVGLWRYDGNTFLNVSKKIRGIYQDREENFWGTDLPRFLPAVLSRINTKSLPDKKVEVIEVFKASGPFLGVSEDQEGNIWIGGGDGVYRYDGTAVTYYTGKPPKN